jgi:type III secretion protein D
MKKEIRVLTGRHAGARLELSQRMYRIGRGSNADIQITDWHRDDMELQVRVDGIVTLDIFGRGRTASRMESLVPRRVREIVLCIGPSNEAWPSDMTLLSSMLELERSNVSVDKEMVSQPVNRKWIGLGTLGLVTALLVCIGTFVTTGQRSSAATISESATAKRSLRESELHRAIAQLRFPGVRVEHDDEAFVISGLVETSKDLALIKDVVERFHDLPVFVRLAVGQDISDQLQSSLREPEVRVQYTGEGAFRIAGFTRDAADLKRRVEHVRADFGSSIKRIDFALEQQSVADTSASSMLTTESITYVELADGTKSFVATPATAKSN